MIGLGVLGARLSGVHSLELILDFLEHSLGGITDGLHGHGGEPVGEHSTDEETSEGERLKDVDLVGVGSLHDFVLSIIHGEDGVGDTGDESTEEGEGDEASGADGETLADSGGGVACSVKIVSAVTDILNKVGHLSDSTSVVGDGAVSVNGEGDREAAEHADGGKSDTVHGSKGEGDKDGDGEAEDGDDAREVAEGESVDDVGGSTVLASFSEFLSRSVLFGGVVLSDEADGETGPETEDDADVALPLGSGVDGAGELDVNTILTVGKDEDGGDDHDGHKDGGNPQLDLKSELNGISSDVSEELADEGSNDANGGDDEREVDGVRSVDHVHGGGGDDKSGAGGLSEGAEKISAHTGNITNVITDVVSDGAWVLGGVLGEGSINFTSEIGTDIGGLGVDTTTDTTEESDGGATEAVSGDELEEVLNTSLVDGGEGSLVGEDEDFEDEKSETDKDESEDLTALEGDLEASEFVDVAKVGNLVVADGSDLHADVSTEHGGGGTNEESDGGVGELGFGRPGGVDGAEDDDREDSAEDGKSDVLFSEESDGTL